MALQHLVSEEAEKLAKGGGSGLDPYAWERPLERANRMTRSSEQLTIYDVKGNAIPVAAIGKVDVTDPWGNPLIGLDSPYDASIAYASNPTKITSRQSVYFGGASPTMPKVSSPALSGRSSMTGSSSGTPMVWSEVSSSSSGMSSTWHDTGSKRRSVSFQGDLNYAAMGGRRSPGASSMHERPRSEFGDNKRPSLKTRSTTNLPSLLGNGRRTFDAESRKSFIDQELPPIPMDPKVAAKRERRQSKAAGLSANKDKSDTLSVMSGISGTGEGARSSKRKSWFARSTSSDTQATVETSHSGASNRPPPLPALPTRHSGATTGSGNNSGSNTPLSTPLSQSPSMLGPVDVPRTGSPHSASPTGFSSRLAPSSAMPPSRSYRNMPSPVEEHPQSPGLSQTSSRHDIPASAPTTPTETSTLAPSPMMKPSPSSPPSFSLHQLASGREAQRPDPSLMALHGDSGNLPKGINKSLSSFQVGGSRVAFPRESQPPTKQPSMQSLVPEQIPLPATPNTPDTPYFDSRTSSKQSSPLPSPAYAQAGPSSEASTPGSLTPVRDQQQVSGLPSGLAVPSMQGNQQSDGKRTTLKPRASSPNLTASRASDAASVSQNTSVPDALIASLSSANTVRSRKSSKSPFSLFKRGRSKTLGETEPQGKSAKGTVTPPVPTPQLSFSSSTSSTTISQAAEDFYADFSPAARPAFTPARKTSTFGSIFGGRRSKGPASNAAPSK